MATLSFYLTGRHDAFLTNAEDFGIMTQAIWNTAHGQMLHQTICNIIFDTNCYSTNGIVRLAIHFEPILFPISLLFLIWPDPKMLLILQTLVVASGAFPAFWLARLRLRNELAGVAIALLYLLYPAQQQATVFDFHAVTFTASLLFFMLYFMYTRRTVWLFVFAILAMTCKEEIPLVVVMFGLWSVIFQRRWRSGFGLVVLGLAWFGLALLIIRLFSPTGQPLLASRYDGGGQGPLSILSNMVLHPGNFLHRYILEPNHLAYLRTLFSPAGYIHLSILPPFYLLLLAPWVVVLALPTLAINLLSSDPQMYSGLFQYNAEIVPVLIFATIESIVVALWLVRVIATRLSVLKVSNWWSNKSDGSYTTSMLSRGWRPTRLIQIGLLAVLLCLSLSSTVRADYSFNGQMPFSKDFQWPTVSAHTALAQHFMDMIPPDASVSAQSALVPHLSQRKSIYLFPYAAEIADYIFLDVTGNIYPYVGSFDYIRGVKTVLLSGNYGIVAAQDGYLLLKRGLPSPGILPVSAAQSDKGADNLRVFPRLPDEFCSNIYVSSQTVPHPLQVSFTDATGRVDLRGFSVDTVTDKYISVTTYWRVSTPVAAPLEQVFLVTDSSGKEHVVSNDVPAAFWCPTNTWKPGTTIELSSRVFGIQPSQVPNGLVHISVALVPLLQSSSTIMDVQARLPVHVVSVPATVTPTRGTNAIQLISMKIVP